MAQILTTQFSILSALSFFKSVSRTSPTPENYFLGFGKQSLWDVETSPETPIDSVEYSQQTKADIIALKKITSSNIAFVVPRYDWVYGETYNQYSDSDQNLFSTYLSYPTKRFYVMTPDFNVYKCLDNNFEQPSIVRPSGTSTSPIITGDGYTWKFMYNLSSTMVSNFLLTNWLPVPYDSQKTAFQIAVENSAIYSSGSPQGGHGFSAVNELGAFRVLISQKFEQSESGVIPTDIQFRQISVLVNPRLISTDGLATGSLYNTIDSNNDIDLTSGELLFLDNRGVINRSEDQSEATKIIIGF